MDQAAKDIDEIVDRLRFDDALKDRTVLITGATGMIGSAILRALLTINRERGLNIRIVAQVRSVEKLHQKLADFETTPNAITVVEQEIQTPLRIEQEIDYIVHTASATDSRFFVERPVDTIDIALSGSKNVLELAKEKQVRKVLYLSSLEVYGELDTFEADEKSIGKLDWTAVRSSYSEGKRMAENLFVAYHSQFRVPSVIARLPQTFGAGIAHDDNRVFAQFARAVQRGEDLILKTKGETVRNYCYLTDAVAGIFTLLLEGAPGEIYNIANEKTACSIAEMAHLIAELGGRTSKVVYDLAEDVAALGYNPTVKIKLVSGKLRNLGWTPTVNLEEALRRVLS